MTITAINLVRGEMLLHNVDADKLSGRLAAKGIALSGVDIAKMIKAKRMPALVFLQIMTTLNTGFMHLPDDISQLS